MSESIIEQHIEAVEAVYGSLIAGQGSRLEGGKGLWGQFTDAVAAYRKRGVAAFPAVIERVNELTVARILLRDPAFANSKIYYEPRIAADDRRIDFVIPDVGGGSAYLEVKTVRPISKDTDTNWKKYEVRKKHHPENVHYVVHKDWLGAQIYGNSFSARAKFMEYTCEFEERLAEAVKIQPGRGKLVFCGTGAEWRKAALEDFADFYLTGNHQPGDAFAEMEAEALRTDAIALQRNIASFGYVRRPWERSIEEEWSADVRGPWAS